MLITIHTFANNQKNNREQATGSGDRVTCVHVDFISLCSVTDFFDKVCCNVNTIFFSLPVGNGFHYFHLNVKYRSGKISVLGKISIFRIKYRYIKRKISIFSIFRYRYCITNPIPERGSWRPPLRSNVGVHIIKRAVSVWPTSSLRFP